MTRIAAIIAALVLHGSVAMAESTENDDPIKDLIANASAAAQSGDWQQAEALFTDLYERQPDQPMHRVGIGRAQMMQQRYAEAIENLSAAREAGAGGPVDYFLARANAGAGNQAAMMAALERIRQAGGTPYLSIMAAPEFRAFDDDPAFSSLVARLRPCQSDAHRAFDFWIGEWEVYLYGTETLAGHNSIQPEEGGCILHERYRTPNGFSGQSLNFYDAKREVWHQTWADNQGTALYIEGGMQGESMVLMDAGKSNRITFTPLDDGSVRQHWESSADGGTTWTTAFDGHYRRAESN